MRCKIMSDLHLEGRSLSCGDDIDTFDILILAGDIHSHTHGLVWARKTYPGKRIVYVPGNHEFYGAHYQGLLKELRSKALELGIDFLNNNTVIIEDVCIMGTILWTDFKLNGMHLRGDAMREARQCMYDYKDIRYSHMGYLTPMHTAQLHAECKIWLVNELQKYEGYQRVVVTHHCPHPNSVPERYKGDLLTPAFTSNLEDIILKYQPNLWVHGHTHDVLDYQVGNTRIVCNPRGYPNENVVFNSNFIVTI